jgi:formylglycine-generating enzyme required for sulfatase activity
MRQGSIHFLILSAVLPAILSCGSDMGESFGKSSVGVQRVEISESEISVIEGKSVQLGYSLHPDNADCPDVSWVSSEPSIVSVSASGLVTAESAGTAIISVGSVSDPAKNARCTVTVTALPDFSKTESGNVSTYTTPGGVAFSILASPDIPEGNTFPYDRTFINGGYTPRSATVPKRFVLAETETTYALWKEVYLWATDPKRGDAVYSFADPGVMGGTNGSHLTLTEKHPVSSVSWGDAIVWCNALTEYFNATNGGLTDLECVYTSGGSVLRSSTSDDVCSSADSSDTAGGFRLPSSYEWELAARYLGTTVPSHSNYVEYGGFYYQKESGSGQVDQYSGIGLDGYGVICSVSTGEVGTKLPNSFGAYDMCGNVCEWCSDLDPICVTLGNRSARILKGGSFRFWDESYEVGYEFSDYSKTVDLSYGFRLAMKRAD